MVSRVNERLSGLVYGAARTWRGALIGALWLWAGACSVDSKVGYTFGQGGGGASSGGALATGGKGGSGGKVGAGGGSARGGNAGAAGEVGTGSGGSSGATAGGGASSGGADGLGGSLQAGAAGAGTGGEGGGAACSAHSCDGGFLCNQGVCETSCENDAGCDDGFFCAGSSCHLNAVEVVTGGAHSCARLLDGSVRCWGSNQHAELGSASTAPRAAQPVAVNGISGALQIAAWEAHTCALVANGDVLCWGENFQGSLGSTALGDATKSAEPVRVELPSAAKATSGTCAVLKTGAVYCWGSNSYGALTDPNLGTYSAKPVAIADLSAASVVSGNSCAIANSGLYCWGNNNDGQCGSGTEPGVLVKPALVSGVSNVLAVTSAGAHACALAGAGGMSCWGSDSYGELGSGPFPDYRSFSPVPVSDLSTPVAAIAAGVFHTCAVLTSGAVYCWGRADSGQLGNGTTTSAARPVAVTGINDAVAVAASFEHSCALRKNGSVWCWGGGLEGQIGTLWKNSSTPVRVPGW